MVQYVPGGRGSSRIEGEEVESCGEQVMDAEDNFHLLFLLL